MKRLVLAEVTADGGAVVTEVREVESGKVAAELVSGFVVSQSSLFCGVEGSEPEPCTVLGESDLSHPLSPVPLPHPSVKLRGL